MSQLTVELSDSLYQAVKQLADEDNNAIKQFIASAVAEKVSALPTEKYSQERRATITQRIAPKQCV